MRGYARRPVHVVVISGMSREALRAGLEEGSLAALEFLSNAGIVRKDCVAPFPSVTPTAVATIATAAPASLHGVLGRAWYHRVTRAVHVFDPSAGDGPPGINYLEDRLAEAGRRVFTFNVPRSCGGSGAGVGLPDRNIADLTRATIRDSRPDLTISVLRSMNPAGHALGPGSTLPNLSSADRQLGRVLESYGSWENAVTAARWLVVGDHGMSGVHPELPSHVFDPADLPLCLGQAVVTTHGRAAFLYLDRPDETRRCELIDAMAGSPAVDQVFWREEPWTRARQRDITCSWRAGSGLQDVRGREWQITGDLRALGLDIVAGQLVEGEYPDPLYRVDDLLDAADAPDLVLTARRGCEFAPRSGHGSHGSLHLQDSLVPLIAAGFGVVPHFPVSRDVPLLAMGALLPEEALAVPPAGPKRR